jgi:NAD+ diphosphatase
MPFEPATLPPADATPLAWCFAFVEGRLLVPDTEPVALPPLAPALFAALASARHYLGRLDGLDCWTFGLGEVPEGWRPVGLRQALAQFPGALTGLAGRAAQLLEWDRAHRFCGVCGTPTQLQAGERARRCPSCGHLAYPRLSPSMMALVWREGELLLARSPRFATGMYSALAGFVEAGESLEECVHREVAEEVGVQVRGLRYWGSQSWPFPHSLMLAFTAEWAGGDIVPQEGEIEHADWFALDALPLIPPRLSIAGNLIRDTVDAMRAGRLA